MKPADSIAERCARALGQANAAKHVLLDIAGSKRAYKYFISKTARDSELALLNAVNKTYSANELSDARVPAGSVYGLSCHLVPGRSISELCLDYSNVGLIDEMAAAMTTMFATLATRGLYPLGGYRNGGDFVYNREARSMIPVNTGSLSRMACDRVTMEQSAKNAVEQFRRDVAAEFERNRLQTPMDVDGPVA